MSQQTQFQQDLIAYITGLVPGAISAKFYAERLPDDVPMPAGVVSFENRDEMYHVGNTKSALEFTEVEFETYGGTLLEAVSLMDQLLAVLTNFKGAMGSTTITKTTKTSDLDGYEDPSQSYYRTVQMTFGHT